MEESKPCLQVYGDEGLGWKEEPSGRGDEGSSQPGGLLEDGTCMMAGQGTGVSFDNVLFLCCVGKALCVPTAFTGLLGLKLHHLDIPHSPHWSSLRPVQPFPHKSSMRSAVSMYLNRHGYLCSA